MNDDRVDSPDGATDDTTGALEPAMPLLPANLDKLPATRLAGAGPSRPARGLAFVSILIGGLCGGLIGFAFTDIQCEQGCNAWAGIAAVIGALVGAIGVAIVAILVLRAMDEWETVKTKDAKAHPSRRRPS